MSSSLALAQFVLSALDAILGDTQTSKAVAAIAELVQRELKNSEVGINGERVGISDVLVGTVAFVILQRWGSERTSRELDESGAQRTVWDVVIVADSDLQQRSQALTTERDREGEREVRPRTMSFMSATGDREAFDAVGDGKSFMAASSTQTGSGFPDRQPSRGADAFRNNISSQLAPGTGVSMIAESLNQDTVSIEIKGDHDAHLEPPAGFSLISRQTTLEGSVTFVFQRRTKRHRDGGFEVAAVDKHRPGSVFADFDAIGVDQSGQDRITLGGERSSLHRQARPGPDRSSQSSSGHPGSDASYNGPATANEKRMRSTLVSRTGSGAPVPTGDEAMYGASEATGLPSQTIPEAANANQHTPTRRSMRKSKSVRKMVDFWSRDRPLSSRHGSETTSSTMKPWTVQGTSAPREEETASSHLSHLERPLSISQGPPPSLTEAVLASYQPRPSSHLRKRSSLHSTMTVASYASDTSMVLHNHDGEQPIATQLVRDGKIRGSFPPQALTANLARFAVFATASYGSTFLRLTHSWQDDKTYSLNSPDLPQHQSFASYIGLTPSTVLLSSYADPEGVGSATSEQDHGLPLVHYTSVDHESKAVVLTCRGTLGFEDILTDLVGDYDDIEWLNETYKVHKGVYAAARRLLTIRNGKVIATLKATLEDFGEYGLVLCGHSLGGAVAAVMAVMLAQKSTTSAGGTSAYVTEGRMLGGSSLILPVNRPIHAYAFGPAACFSPELQQATRGLITTVVYGQDFVPHLSLGHLRDFQAMALAFKTDSHNATTEVLRRVRQAIFDAFRDKSGLVAFQDIFSTQTDAMDLDDEDHWPWIALNSLRASMLADKLCPPGEVFAVESQPVLQRHAFVEASSKNDGTKFESRSFRPATHIKLIHVGDVETWFREMKFGASMFADHFPGRYERALTTLHKGLGRN